MYIIKTTPINAKVFVRPNKTKKIVILPAKIKNPSDHCSKCNGDKWVVCDECKHEFLYCHKCKCQGIIKCEKCNHCL